MTPDPGNVTVVQRVPKANGLHLLHRKGQDSQRRAGSQLTVLGRAVQLCVRWKSRAPCPGPY